MEWFTADRVFVEGAYRPARWLGVEGGTIREVADRPPGDGAVVAFADAAIFPGTVNTHTHAFHSLLRGCGDDLPLLEWLYDVVYRHAALFTPEQAYLGAALAFGEMLKNGITTVVDFFYLNGQGQEYARATIRAAEDLGMRLVLARTFMDLERAPGTIRESVPQAAGRYGELARAYRGHPTVRICPAAHSLHAASTEMIHAAAQCAKEQGSCGTCTWRPPRGPSGRFTSVLDAPPCGGCWTSASSARTSWPSMRCLTTLPPTCSWAIGPRRSPPCGAPACAWDSGRTAGSTTTA